jgi:cytochrome c oxidase subunit 2
VFRVAERAMATPDTRHRADAASPAYGSMGNAGRGRRHTVRRRGGLLAVRLAVPATALALASACGTARYGMPRPATREASKMLWLWQLSMVAALVVGGITACLILFAALRYRRRRGAAGLPAQTAFHVPLEVAYTVVPVVVVALLFAATYGVQRAVLRNDSRDALVVDVSGFDWSWSFHYAGTAVTVTGGVPAAPPPVLVLPVGRPVRLRIASTDVVHSFWVPRFLFKLDAIPGRTNEMQITVSEAGRFVGRCAEFCGVDHAHMTFVVEALSSAEFDAWLANGGHHP